MNFFDQYPRFYRTSQTSPWPRRLNARHAAIIGPNVEALKGRRVIDIASHDGRWTFAALQAGATHVVGIEPRAELIANARESLTHYGVSSDRYELRQGDVFDLLDGSLQADVVLCLGFYYHTIRHAELLDRIERTGARLVVIDTEVAPMDSAVPRLDDPRLVYGNPYVIQLLQDPVDDQQMACADALTRKGRTLVGRPSRAAIQFMAEHFGFNHDSYPWRDHFQRHPADAEDMVDYFEGWRDTFYLTR
ncbi:MAG TPA: class I SAM-dependent methyltransferase [Lysobacter sp.]|nr:class I SAM-dependent methyltransferase [Lysobacter sp.]